MIDTIYIEEEIKNHPRTLEIKNRYPNATTVLCNRYGEIFNRKEQNFRLQKIKPALILAKKYGSFVHPIPKEFSLGREENYYFSHILNCPFDCKYCFLQGMYPSANFVLFVNFEDFQEAIDEKIGDTPTCFFSGYDGDSLAMEPTTKFLDSFLPFFAKRPKAELEIRTKSIATRPLLKQSPLENVILAYTLNPEIVANNIEKKAPPFKARLKAIEEIQAAGWPIGLRFDPVIYCKEFEKHYSEMFREVFEKIDLSRLHSITLGQFRMPKNVEKKMTKLMPYEPLLASNQKDEILYFCQEEIFKYAPKEKVYICHAMS